MKTNTPLLEKFKKGDVIQYVNNVLEIVSEERAATMKIVPQRTQLQSTMSILNANWQVNRGSELTPQIAQLDRERDSLFLGLKMTVDAWAAHHFEETKKEAAFLISDLITSYGDKIQLMRYQQETATLNAIINDLETKLPLQVSLLALNTWVIKLKEVNTIFNAKYIERAKAISLDQDESITALRIQVLAEYKALKNIMEARSTIAVEDKTDTVETFTLVVNELNVLTDQYNNAVTRNATSISKNEVPNTDTATESNTNGGDEEE
ncbi:conserved hypothetical protein [Tenacibaculum sp. 190524A02b]|uniref:Uncharacterized protein n=1 Tax=Tenacibaculum vairaonense TaxID=3137860 RepID=A0ABM9PHC9_9FLAO